MFHFSDCGDLYVPRFSPMHIFRKSMDRRCRFHLRRNTFGLLYIFYRQPRTAIEIESECLKLYKRNQEWSFSLKSIEKIIILDQGGSLDFTVHLNDFSKFGFHFLIENSEKTKREWIRCLEECGVKVIMETSPV